MISAFASCDRNKIHPSVTITSKSSELKLLPLGKIDQQYIDAVVAQLQKTHTNIEVLPEEALPAFAYYAPRNRYRADSIIDWLQKRSANGEVYIALTAADISTTKGNINDFGVMGLGYMPGRACIASLYRLKNKNNFYKIAIHELGHTAGLPHCPEKFCYLRDARGGDHTREQISFCESCTGFLKKKNWNL